MLGARADAGWAPPPFSCLTDPQRQAAWRTLPVFTSLQRQCCHSVSPYGARFLPVGLVLALVSWEWSGGKEACCDLPPCPRPCPGAPKPSQLCSLPGQLRGGRGYQAQAWLGVAEGPIQPVTKGLGRGAEAGVLGPGGRGRPPSEVPRLGQGQLGQVRWQPVTQHSGSRQRWQPGVRWSC